MSYPARAEALGKYDKMGLEDSVFKSTNFFCTIKVFICFLAVMVELELVKHKFLN